MRTTITLQDEAYELALSLSKASGKRLGETISELIRRSQETPVKGMRATDKRRRPAFTVPEGTPAISLRAVRRAWEEAT